MKKLIIGAVLLLILAAAVSGDSIGGGGGGSGSVTRISQQSLASPAATVTFSNIPSTYTNLIIRGLVRSTAVAQDDTLYMQVNGDTGANYDSEQLKACNITASAIQTTGNAKPVIADIAGGSTSAAWFSAVGITLYSYSNAFSNKTSTISNGSGGSTTCLFSYANWWDYFGTTNAISSITLGLVSGSNFATNTVFTLYGES